MSKNVFDFLMERGYIFQHTDVEKLKNELEKNLSFYIGFDPTADSLHIGHFLTLMVIRHLQKYGNKPILIVGGGTGFVGDPSGRNDMRQMIDKKIIEHNCECFKKQMSRFIKFEGENAAIIKNNADWLLKLNWIEFLREFGACFTVNKMLTAEAFKTRFQQEQGLTFLEFNYMLMQAYDYYYLNKEYNVTLQIGGSDQWSNIIAGADLIRRKTGKDVNILTLNLLTKSDGTKMGKTSTGAIWLDENKTSPYNFYQFWLNIDDADVKKMFLLLTEIEKEEIEKICNVSGKDIVNAKKRLAFEVTKIIHGNEKANLAVEQSEAAFNNIGNNMPTFVLKEETISSDDSISNILVLLKLSPSKSESRRLIQSNAISINEIKIIDVNTKLKDLNISDNSFVIHKGKKNRLKVIFKK